ncbi:MAG: amidohydrolase [Deltaproteobacteria bacterium]|nr:amidohydrolase [Deltaproteobacteria bacterium]
MNADLVIKNGKVITVDPDFSIKQAIAVKNGRILAVGSDGDMAQYITADTKVLDLKSKTILPGINDSHMHGASFGMARPPLSLDLSFPAVQSISDMVDILKKKVDAVEKGEWIRGGGWDQGEIEECKHDPARMPRKSDLDSVSPDNPVIFFDFSGHTLLVNSKALELAGVTKDTPDPPTGEIERDASGEPTGIFKEPGAMGEIFSVAPPPSKEQLRTAVLTNLTYLNANGITSFTDAAVGPGGQDTFSNEIIDIYQELLTEGNLTTRVTVLLLLGNYGALTYEELENGIKNYTAPAGVDKNWLQFPGVKLFADGIPLSYTSWMNEDYVSGDAGKGKSVIPGETEEEQRKTLIEMVKLAHRHGYQVGIHATGDRAIDASIDGFVEAVKEGGGDLRHYIIHGDFVSPEGAKILSRYNFGISMQPYIQVKICDFEPTVVGEKRAAYEWPTRTVLDEDVKLTFSSDAPVTEPNWRLGVQAAVLREGLASGKVSGPEQCVTVEEALRAYTITGAWQDGMETVKGSIEVGKVADFCVIGDDILSIDPHKIGEIPVLMTIVDGRIVFDASIDQAS